jgi:hypothetical protein
MAGQDCERAGGQLSLLEGPVPAGHCGAAALVVRIGGCDLAASPVFGTYWRFAAARQAMYEARLAGRPGPWTDDPVLRQYRFTNCYRAADRVSQFGIREVAYKGPQAPGETVFRVLLFKIFNKIATWQLLEQELGPPAWASFNIAAYDQVLSEAFSAGTRLYSPAYVMPAPPLGAERKHTNYLRLLKLMMEADIAGALQRSPTMSAAFDLLRAVPGLGDFLAFQFLIDINYSTALSFDEMEFVVAGPGARDGIRKCFGRRSDGLAAEVIRYMAEHQGEHFARLGLSFPGLRGRPLQLVDCQNLFCEVSKYSRVAHPDIAGISGRTRIKQRFVPARQPVDAWFPPKWGI